MAKMAKQRRRWRVSRVGCLIFIISPYYVHIWTCVKTTSSIVTGGQNGIAMETLAAVVSFDKTSVCVVPSSVVYRRAIVNNTGSNFGLEPKWQWYRERGNMEWYDNIYIYIIICKSPLTKTCHAFMMFEWTTEDIRKERQYLIYVSL